MQFKTFDINPGGLQWDDTFVERPFYVAPSKWVEFLESIKELASSNMALEDYDNSHEIDEKDAEIRQLEKEVSELEDDLDISEKEVKSLEAEIQGLLTIIDELQTSFESNC